MVFSGTRGVGKSTFLLNLIKNQKILYISADLPFIQTVSLFDLGKEAFALGYEGIAVDEVHYARDWSLHLKALYDSFPRHKIYASDSSSSILRSGYGDLSRRFLNVNIPLLSFREYIYFQKGKLFPTMDLFGSHEEKEKKILKEINILDLFQNYLKSGLRPIFLEGDYQSRILGIIEKTIYSDIPFFVPSIVDNNFRLMNAILAYLAQSPIPSLSIRSLCKEWNIGAEKLYKLLTIMENVGLIRVIRKVNDFKGYSTGEKIFLFDPSLYWALEGNLGNVREAFFVAMVQESSQKLWASPDEKKGDFMVGGKLVEIGGKNKSQKKSDLVFRDGLDFSSGPVKALWTTGFLY